MFVTANWPAIRSAHWETLLRARAIETQSYVVGVNCVGERLSIPLEMFLANFLAKKVFWSVIWMTGHGVYVKSLRLRQTAGKVFIKNSFDGFICARAHQAQM